ncbi:MAG: glutamate--cysteine ligase [Actinomycetota bacterium]|nr:glutamate--cysteine ligase [Actinomycetota bacterium]
MMRTMGVEEELLLVDAQSGEVRSSAETVLRTDSRDLLSGELQQEQIETGTRPRTDLSDVHTEIVELRRHGNRAAAEIGARIAALGTSPLVVAPRTAPHARYQKIVERFAITASEQLTCGFHVHVGVEDDEQGVAALDRVRVWLPTLLALSANSPFWQGADTSYASFRSQSWSRWPSAGPTPIFGTAQNYHALVRRLIESGTVLDEGMIYFDARLSAHYPTVELRAADVCRRPQDATLLAGLARGLVETAIREWQAGRPASDMPTELLRVATWRAARSGLEGELVQPSTGRPAPAVEVVAALLDHIRAALSDAGDLGVVKDLLGILLDRGNGARAQRETFTRTQNLNAVVLEAVTDGSSQDGLPGTVLRTPPADRR